MKIALLSHWLIPTAYFDFSLSLLEELFRLGHEMRVLAPELDPAEKIPSMEEGKGVIRFSKGAAPGAVLHELIAEGVEVLLVHAECVADKHWLNSLIQEFTKGNRTSYLFIHSNEYHTQVNYSLYTALLYPHTDFMRQLPGGSIRAMVLPQGVPEYVVAENEDFRQFQNLPYPDAVEGHNKGRYLVALEGKTPLDQVLQALDFANKHQLQESPVYLFAQCCNPKRFDYMQSLGDGVGGEWLIASLSYLPGPHLAALMHYSDGVILAYPEPMHKPKVTSSLIRFAAAAGAPIITNVGGHTADLTAEHFTASFAPSTAAVHLKHAIVDHFSKLEFKKAQARRTQAFIREHLGWSKIAKKLMEKISPKGIFPAKVLQGV